MHQIFKLLAAAGIVFIASAAQAQKVPEPDLEQVLAVYDLNRDGVLSAEEIALINRDVQITRKRAARRQSGSPHLIPVAPVAAKPADNNLRGVLLLRDQYSLVPFITAEEKLSKNGATISWTSDRLKSTTTIQGSGALFYALHGDIGLNTPGTVDSRAPRLTHLALVPGVEWDLLSRNGRHEGTVALRGGAEFEISGGLFPTQYVRATALHTTDVATSSAQLYSGEISFIPVAPRLRVGSVTQLSESLGLWLGFFPTLGLEYSHVGPNGNFGSLVPGYDYLWVGPKVHAELMFLTGPFSGLSFLAKYFYLYETLNGAKSHVDFLETAVRYTLGNWDVSGIDPASRAELSATFKYTVGTTPRTLTRKDEFFAGLEVRLGDLR